MGKFNFVAVFISALLFAGSLHAEPQRQNAPVESDRQREAVERREREKACDCCTKCMAATRTGRMEGEGVPAKDGCRDCCRRCGTTELPTKPKPPEIVK